MKKIILLKLGGSLITDKTKPYTARMKIVRNLAVQIKAALRKDSKLQFIIGNGSGSFAHYPAVKYKIRDGIIKEDQKIFYRPTRWITKAKYNSSFVWRYCI